MLKGARNTGLMRQLGTGLVCAAALALCALPANAQEDGSIVDPESPSGKEYEIPFESARRQADPRQIAPENSSSGRSQATLFGEGITAPSAARAAKSGGGASSGASGASSGESKTDGSGTDPQPGIVKIAASQPGAPDSGLGTSALFLGIAVVVLLIGAGAGLVFRRRAS